MSAWEGSAWQEANERRAAERWRRISQVCRENPSLTPDQARAWVMKLEADEARAARLARCCRCQGLGRAEVVSIDGILGVCRCGCHQTENAR